MTVRDLQHRSNVDGRAVVDEAHPLLLAVADIDASWEFEHRVHEWVCEHRAAALRDHDY
jgi:hypothetical protein